MQSPARRRSRSVECATVGLTISWRLESSVALLLQRNPAWRWRVAQTGFVAQRFRPWSCCRGFAIATLWLSALSGCNQVDSPRAATEGNVVRVYQPLQALTATLEAGEDCSVPGQSGCISGYCLHISALPDKGYVCSIRCGNGVLCPDKFTCSQVVGTESYCIPPRAWIPRKTVARGASGSPREPGFDAGNATARTTDSGDGGAL